MSTSIIVVNITASNITGKVSATFNIPGISLSLTPIFKNLFNATVGANDPIPKVSKKLVEKPTIPALTVLVSSSFPALAVAL